MVVVRICNTGQAKVTDLGENKTGHLLRESKSLTAEPHRRQQGDGGAAQTPTGQQQRRRPQVPPFSRGRAPRDWPMLSLAWPSQQPKGSRLVSERGRLPSSCTEHIFRGMQPLLICLPTAILLRPLIHSYAPRISSSPQQALEQSPLRPTTSLHTRDLPCLLCPPPSPPIVKPTPKAVRDAPHTDDEPLPAPPPKKIQLLISPDSRKLALTMRQLGLLRMTMCEKSDWSVFGPKPPQGLLIPSSWGTNPRERC